MEVLKFKKLEQLINQNTSLLVIYGVVVIIISPFLPSSPLLLLFSSSPPQFSLFGSRSTSRTTNPPSSSSSSSSPVIPSAPSVKRVDRPPCAGAPGLSKAEFLERVRRSNQACQQGEYALAVHLYSEALAADPQNCILYSNRSAAYLRLGQYSTALDDAIKARVINPKWPKVRGLTPGDPSPPNHSSVNGFNVAAEWMCPLR